MRSGALNSSRLTALIVQVVGIALVAAVGFYLMKKVCDAQPRYSISGIPAEPPTEAHRVFHPSGFSVVRPAYWESSVGWKVTDGVVEGGIDLWSPPGVKPVANLSIQKLVQRPRLAGPIRAHPFQDEPAEMAVERRPAVWMDYPGMLTVEIAFRRDGSWWLLRYRLFRECESIPEVMSQYVETFSSRSPLEPNE